MKSPIFSTLQKPIIKYLKEAGIDEESEVQSLGIPSILQGKNVLLIAPTGMGKTYAAILPVFDMFLSAKGRGEVEGISILYITPLRALNRDVHRRLIELGRSLGIDVKVRHGDTSQWAREVQARTPPDMLITTPETLQAILPGKRLKEHLKHVRWVIVDEVHELVDDERGVQLSTALERLYNIRGEEFQRIGLSATIGEPSLVARFLVGEGRDVEVIKTSEDKRYEVTIEYVSPSRDDVKIAGRYSLPPSYVSRVRRIIRLISQHKSTLIFTNTREHAEALGSLIYALAPNLSSRVHHGSLSKEIREDVERAFHTGKVRVVICTSSLELGMDIGSVDLVIQYMSPRQAIKLVQRIGRSGHKLDATPKGIIVAASTDDIIESTALLKRAGNGILERPPSHEAALDVLAHQIVGLALDERGIYIEDAYSIVKRAHPYRTLKLETFKEVFSQLEALRILRLYHGGLRPYSPRAYRYYYENLSVIPDIKHYSVFDFIAKRKIGTLDQGFVAKRCNPGIEFVMHGHTWKVVSRDESSLKIDVEPTTPSFDAIPSWEGEMIPVDYYTALEVGRLREAILNIDVNGGSIKKIAEEWNTNIEAVEKTVATLREHIKRNPLPTHTRIVIERFERFIIIHSSFGSLVNEAFGLAITAILRSKYSASFLYQSDPYRIAIQCPFPIDPKIVEQIFKSLTPSSFEEIIDVALESTEAFIWRHWHVAKRFGVVERKAEYSSHRARILVDLFHGTVLNKEAKREMYTEKLDITHAKQVLEGVESREITVEIAETMGEEPSPLSSLILDKIIPHALLRPITPSKSLIELVKERLQSRMVKLVCIHRGDWEAVRKVEQLPEKIQCKKCRSTLIAVTYPDDLNLTYVVRKKLSGQTLSRDEKEMWRKGWQTAGLVQIYGKKAILALAGRGVGPATAVRVLRKPLRKKEDFYVEILKAERVYARTRSFWD